MSAFTPGPWRFREINPKDKDWGACEIIAGRKFVATMVCGVTNASLIAVAPELHKTLRWFSIRSDAIQALFDLHGPKDTADAMRENFKAARAALSKVKG